MSARNENIKERLNFLCNRQRPPIILIAPATITALGFIIFCSHFRDSFYVAESNNRAF